MKNVKQTPLSINWPIFIRTIAKKSSPFDRIVKNLTKKVVFTSVAASAFIFSSKDNAMADVVVKHADKFETVFQWKSDRCSDRQYPDSPARAVRMPNGQIFLYATHYSNVPLVGTSFSDLRPACALTSSGHENANPNAFDDRFWIQAVALDDKKSPIALASHEYMGSRHDNCNLGNGTCWYSSIVLLKSDRNHRFELAPMPSRVVARSPNPYSANIKTPQGFFTTSNIFKFKDHYYFFGHSRGIPGQRDGNCLFRAESGSNFSRWYVWSKGDFVSKLSGPLEDHSIEQQDKGCDIISSNILSSPLRSLVYSNKLRKWVAVLVKSGNQKNNSHPDGIYLSTSENLIDWNNESLILPIDVWKGQKYAGVYYNYPSIIDHSSKSPIFDTAEGEMYLYLTRYNFYPDRSQGDNRDLVRIKLTIENQ